MNVLFLITKLLLSINYKQLIQTYSIHALLYTTNKKNTLVILRNTKLLWKHVCQLFINFVCLFEKLEIKLQVVELVYS